MVPDKMVEITAVPKKHMATHTTVSRYFCFSRYRGITKYMRAYASEIWAIMYASDSSVEANRITDNYVYPRSRSLNTILPEITTILPKKPGAA
jgi:hypothetical protein